MFIRQNLQVSSRRSVSNQRMASARSRAGPTMRSFPWNAGQELSGTTPVANRILGDTDEFFNRTDSTGTYSPIKDALGNVLALTNSSGVITTQYGYDPFGTTTTSGGTSTNVSQFTSRENDGNGLYSYRARYYSPHSGDLLAKIRLDSVVESTFMRTLGTARPT